MTIHGAVVSPRRLLLAVLASIDHAPLDLAYGVWRPRCWVATVSLLIHGFTHLRPLSCIHTPDRWALIDWLLPAGINRDRR